MYRNLSCDLSEKEIAVYSQELARVTGEQFEIENEKKESMSTFTARLNKCVADRNVLARKVITKKEDRQVECDLDFDYTKGMVYTVRMDTGVTIDQRKLTDDERQQRLDLEGEQDAEQAAEEKAEAVEVVESPANEEPAAAICFNEGCEHYVKNELSGCSLLEYVEECDTAIITGPVPPVAELTEEEKNTRAEVCDEWEACRYADLCFDEAKNVKGLCFKDSPEALTEITKTGETLPVCGNTSCGSYDLQCSDHCAVSEGLKPVTGCTNFTPEVSA
jgi:hypothetical protein